MSEFGTKAQNLLVMKNEFNLNVPEFLAVPFSSLIFNWPAIQQTATTTVNQYLRGVTDIDECLANSNEMLSNLSLVTESAEQTLRQLQGWDRVSFRTSAALEDSSEHSFAGQYESFLDQELNAETLNKYVLACFASMLTPRVLGYAKEHGLTDFQLGGSVVIQKMFYGQYSGVLFTENGRGKLQIATTTGWQNLVVEGGDSADLLIGREECFNGKLAEQAPAIQELCKAALRIEARIGSPVDIEFSVNNTEVAFLQYRPQTTAFTNYLLEWDSTNISENYPGTTLPLTYSYIRNLYAGVYPAFFRLLGTSEKRLAAQTETFENMLGYLNGHVYYRISNWYQALKLLPGKSNQEFFESMLNPVTKKGTDAAKRKSRLDLGSALAILRFLILLGRSERLSRKFRNRLVPQLALLNSYQLDFIDAATVFQALKRGRVEMLSKWAVPILNDVKLMVFHGLLKRFFAADQTGEYLGFLQGLTDRASIKPLEGLAWLGRVTRSAMDGEAVATIDALKRTPSWDLVVEAANKYIVDFGARTPDELKLENPRLTEQLDAVLSLAINAESAKLDSPARTTKNLAWPTGLAPWKRPVLRYVGNQTRRAIDWRERFRFNRAQFFDVARNAFTAIGSSLKAEDVIAETRDVFWLTEQEVDELVNGHAWSMNAKDTVAARKAVFNSFQSTNMDLAVHGAGRIAAKHLSAVQPSSPGQGLRGTGVAPGTLTAEVVVATEFDATLDVRGKILVVHHIDPGWTLLFTQAAGIVAEKGNALSHAAIIAREIGIPAVVAAVGATSQLTTGQTVTINGITGSISHAKN